MSRSRAVRAGGLGCSLLVVLVAAAACTTGDDPVGTPTSTAGQSGAPSGDLTAPPRDTLDRFYNQQLTWGPCADQGPSATIECSTLTVPLDYFDPGGATIEIAINRVPSAEPNERLGSLVVNPGGPGGSGVDYAARSDIVSSWVAAAYDIVGFDPRGVARSAPVTCLDNEQLDEMLSMDQSPDDDAELAALDAMGETFAEGCTDRSGELLPYLGTVDVARDLDVLRAALHDEKLHYLGKSYGTFIGALYAEQFPQNVGHLVLDGAVDPAQSSADSALNQAEGFEAALRAFSEDCLLYIEECPFFGEDVDAGLDLVTELFETTDADPLPTSSGRPLTQSLAVLGVAVTLYDAEFGWPRLRQALASAEDGNGTDLLELSDIYTERQSDGSYASNSNEAIYAVSCLDHGVPDTLEESVEAAPEYAEAAPRFGPYIAYGSLPCAHWPAPATFSPHRVAAAGADPILVVGTTRDPATPYASAEALADQLESAVLLTLRGDGHTAYQRGHPCIDEAVDAYLLTGDVPAAGTRC